MNKNLDPALVRALFDYKDGVLYWKAPAPKRTQAGAVAGCLHKQSGAWHINYMGSKYLRSRLVWLWHHGEFPAKAWIRRRNDNPTDDRIENLHARTSLENTLDLGTYRGTVPGVTCAESGFIARLNDQYIGIYQSLDDAEQAFALAYTKRYGTPPPQAKGGVNKSAGCSFNTSPPPPFFIANGISPANIQGAGE
ncbi:HNH endonuclease signature motif containing protein [Ferribacterium limneticum]|uniref:HNH endonuclease signature motif containing protein n=1 Tax=Ferribacterium limneticum TaxID=76259 RepID=UPI001CFB2987|nr:HNH endonuclease signature motif containing protein [Ferribacterium limneticum]UCV26999.1 HNH endonuclease [Ferribacterium limneticum]UCV30916.1 HNH endonuclease [Ferribacterium limneticum]